MLRVRVKGLGFFGAKASDCLGPGSFGRGFEVQYPKPATLNPKPSSSLHTPYSPYSNLNYPYY